ncbi:MAG: MogA/MoaB family molybdenum cofactor biosynthesis protein [candidate division NC10 bacterium]|nr:MogA/MoaB family molybdenum cofactor biosynthesis protein [candidate division NC10 bacterium]
MRVAVLTVSDRSARGERPDASGPAIAARLKEHGWPVERTAVVSDDQARIESMLAAWADDNLDLILTTGGTGFSPRDHTPEATAAVCDRIAPGVAEAMRQAGLVKTPHAMLSRAVAGMRGKTLIINLPGSPQGAVESLEVVLPALEHGLRLLRDDAAAETGHRLE